jgi:hypothetical protein
MYDFNVNRTYKEVILFYFSEICSAVQKNELLIQMTIQVHIKNMLGEAIMIQMSIQSTIPFI